MMEKLYVVIFYEYAGATPKYLCRHDYDETFSHSRSSAGVFTLPEIAEKEDELTDSLASGHTLQVFELGTGGTIPIKQLFRKHWAEKKRLAEIALAKLGLDEAAQEKPTKRKSAKTVNMINGKEDREEDHKTSRKSRSVKTALPTKRPSRSKNAF